MPDLPSKEELEARKKITEEILDRNKSIKEIMEGTGDAAERLKKVIMDTLGAQAQYATSGEKASAALEDQIKAMESELALQRELTLLQEKQERLKGKRGNQKFSADELDRLARLTELMKDKVDVSEEEIKSLKAKKVAQDKLTGAQRNAAAVTKNSLEETLGLKDASGTLAASWIDASAAGGGLEDVVEGMSKALSETVTKTNLLKMATAYLQEYADKAEEAIFSADGLLMQFQQLGKEFAQSTGLSQKLGEEIKSLTISMNSQHFTMEETNRAYETLAVQSQAFTNLTKEGRAALTEQALQFSRLGVSADTFAGTVDGLNKVFGNTPAEINKTTEEISNFGRALGVGPNEMLSEFNKQLPLLARYGKEKGVEMFKELAHTAKLAGLEMSELLNVASAFDTFEGAAESAGKLNFMLGGPLINSMEMLNATEEERIKMLRDAVTASGKSFEEMGRFEKDLIAKTLGVDVSVAQKLFSDQNIGSIEEARKALDENANSMGSLNKQAEEATTIAQRQKAADEALLELSQHLGGAMETAHIWMAKINQVMTFISPLLMVASYLIGAYISYLALMKIEMFKTFAAKIKLMNMDKIRELAHRAWQKIAATAQWAWQRAGAAAEWASRQAGRVAEKAALAAGWLWEKTMWIANAAWQATIFAAGIAMRVAGYALLVVVGVGAAVALAAAWVAGAAITAAAWIAANIAMLAPFIAIGLAIAALWIYWDDIVEFFSSGASAIGNSLSSMGDKISSIMTGVLNGIKDVAKGIAEAIMHVVFAIPLGIATAIDWITGKAADLANKIPGVSFSGTNLASSVGGVKSSIMGSIDSFKDGGTNVKGGAALVGEAGPELVTLPQGSNVVTNENVNRLANKGASSAAPQEAVINLTFKLDGDVLAKHTQKIAMNTLNQSFEFTGGVYS